MTKAQKYRRLYYLAHKERENKLARRWRAVNKEKMRQYGAEYRRINKSRIYRTQKRWLAAQKAKGIDYQSLMYIKHKSKISARQRQRNQLLKLEVVKAYGRFCSCCGESEIRFLSIDHVKGDGKRHRDSLRGRGFAGSAFYRYLKSKGFPDKDKLQVLCFNCNMAKGTHGICPHQEIMVGEWGRSGAYSTQKSLGNTPEMSGVV